VATVEKARFKCRDSNDGGSKWRVRAKDEYGDEEEAGQGEETYFIILKGGKSEER